MVEQGKKSRGKGRIGKTNEESVKPGEIDHAQMYWNFLWTMGKEPAAKQVFGRGILKLADKKTRSTARDIEHD